MAKQLTLDFDTPAPVKPATVYVCVACGNRQDERARGWDCPVCEHGTLIDSRAWDEPPWLAELIEGEW